MYKETQPNKPTKGFLTSDYSKRDEFSNTVRTAQYRELLTVRGWGFSGDPTWHAGTFHARICSTPTRSASPASHSNGFVLVNSKK